jgi:Asp-tRNA(Asn)/Glu-tRNA(Gln) amidotransferase A subunit family amidase
MSEPDIRRRAAGLSQGVVRLAAQRRLTMAMDLAGVPAICLPSGVSSDGLPDSIQFTGRRLGESMLCRIAHSYGQATTWQSATRIWPPADGSERSPLAGRLTLPAAWC